MNPQRPDLRLRQRQSRRGFSLIEIMLVVVIIGMLMGVAAYSMLGQGNKARIATTKMSLHTIDGALQQYNLEKGSYPASLSALTSGSTPYLKLTNLTDGWKHPIWYAVPGPNGKPYSLYSAGPDGEAGTQDDIDVWTMDQDTP